MTNRTIAALLLSLSAAAAALPAPASAQETGEAARRAEMLDRLLGANAALPRPDPAPAETTGWLPAPLPPWLAAQPYRQQPLFATVPGDVTVGGRSRRRGSTP